MGTMYTYYLINTMYKRMTEQHSAGELLIIMAYFQLSSRSNLAVNKTRPVMPDSLAYDIIVKDFMKISGNNCRR